MAHRINEPWHVDAFGQAKPDQLVGKKYLHVKTGTVYKVTSYRLNTTNDSWMLDYNRVFGEGPSFEMSRDMHQFLDGRFVEVK